MRMRFWFPALSTAALGLVCLSAERGQAGSFFGPCCYGAPYTEQYPNRSHNLFGSAAGYQCPARHPLFKHRWFRKHQGAPCDGAQVNGMPVNMMPGNTVPGSAMPVEVMQPPIVQAPIVQAPVMQAPITQAVQTPAPVIAAPISSERIAPVPAPLPKGPATAEPPTVNQTSKPPF